MAEDKIILPLQFPDFFLTLSEMLPPVIPEFVEG